MVVNRIGDIAPGALPGQYRDFGQWNKLAKMFRSFSLCKKYIVL